MRPAELPVLRGVVAAHAATRPHGRGVIAILVACCGSVVQAQVVTELVEDGVGAEAVQALCSECGAGVGTVVCGVKGD